MTERYFPISEYERRWDLVHAEMRRRGVETAVVWGRSGGTYDRASDIYYLSNYYGNNSGQGFDNALQNCRAFSAVILRAGEKPELIIEESSPHLNLLATDRFHSTWDPVTAVAECLRARKDKGPVAFLGTDFFSMKHWRELEAATPGVTWQFEDDIVRKVRRVKSTPELDAYREGGLIASRACTLLIEGLLSGKSEAEAAGDAAREVVRSGGAIHMIPISHGDKIDNMCRNPLPGYSHDTPKAGDLIRGFVYGPMFQGYYLDPGRTVVAGRKPTHAQRELVESCVEVTDALLAALRPGLKVKELVALGDKLKAGLNVEDDEMAKKFPLYGHGLGLFFEQPIFSVAMGYGEDEFVEGMVAGIEVFFARPGIGSVGFEQNAIVTSNGIELLTKTPMLWW
ncbi:M24 family metallopeptidase [Taklimakanibacter deserti]|uniref:M24 family metallopeptidase n=1 Tax=Taklimakanibacter deserti TaxID=2267839 RepID=UPI000E648ED5